MAGLCNVTDAFVLPDVTKVTDIGRIVRLTNPTDPLYTGEPGLLLESAKPLTL